MADKGASGSPSPADIIADSMKMVSAVETAVQKTLTDFVTTADTEIKKLVEANTLPPDTAKEMLAMHQDVINKTIDIIKATPVTWPPDAGGDAKK